MQVFNLSVFALLFGLIHVIFLLKVLNECASCLKMAEEKRVCVSSFFKWTFWPISAHTLKNTFAAKMVSVSSLPFVSQGDELVMYLQSTYFPAQNADAELAQQFCQALKSDSKVFRTYFKVRFGNFRSVKSKSPSEELFCLFYQPVSVLSFQSFLTKAKS